jgi:hypothetical protein
MRTWASFGWLVCLISCLGRLFGSLVWVACLGRFGHLCGCLFIMHSRSDSDSVHTLTEMLRF